MEFTQNELDKHDILNKIIILNKLVSDMIHDIIPTKYQTYFSTTILEHANFLAKVNKSPQEHLHNMTSRDAYSITIHVRTVTLADISHEQKQ